MREDVRLKALLHDKFVCPLIESFEKVHSDYVTAFARYREMISENGLSFNVSHPVFAAIQTDQIFSSGIRGKLLAAGSQLQEMPHGTVSRFAWSILGYLGAGSEVDFYPCNSHRAGLLRCLQLIAEDVKDIGLKHYGIDPQGQGKEKAAIALIDHRVQHLQRLYIEIHSAYNGLKQVLLK